jgi:hypothetical protein
VTTPPVIYSAPAGTRWQNTTGAIAYQFRASLVNTCARCLPYHGKIAAWWPIPIHFKCQCDQTAIMPGDAAPIASEPLTVVIDSLPQRERQRVLGKSVSQLLDAGLITLAAVATASRIRPAGEVIAKAKLTDEQLKAAGVRRVKDQGKGSDEERDREYEAQLGRDLVSVIEAHAALVQSLSAGLAAGAGAGIPLVAELLRREIEAWRRPEPKKQTNPQGTTQ